MPSIFRVLAWLGVAVAGGVSYAVIATRRGEPLSSGYVVLAAICTYALGYRFYSKWIAARVLALEDRRATPSMVHEDGKDFVRTNRWIVFGHHFAAISGPGPLVGPVLAAQFGYLPGTFWILVGVLLGGAVQDFVILFSSMRRRGKSLGQMVREELNGVAGAIALVAILAIMIILLAVLGLVVVKVLAESPWGVFTVGATIPIAMLMGGCLRWWMPGRTLAVSVMGVVLLLLAVWGGQFVHFHPAWSKGLTFTAEPLAWSIIVYGVAASVLPVWLLLAPRDYLSTFMKLGTIFSLAAGVLLVMPELKMPAVTRFVDGTGLVVAGKLFPFCFITIACGAISGFHSLVSSGITPKIIARESHARSVGYGAMCLESLVAIMAIIAACTLDPGVYLAMNVKGTGADAAAVASDIVAKVKATGFTVDPARMDALAREVGEHSLYGRTGGAATLAVGMANIFSQVTRGRWLDLWYHFAIMFEALFILTTLDAGTRVGRYLLQDFLGHVWKPLGDTQSVAANVLASVLVVSGWGYFLVQGVRDPLGGINSLWPLFGIANQLLAAIALCLATTVILKMALARRGVVVEAPRRPGPAERSAPALRSALVAFVTLVPLTWLLTVTFTAGWQKMFDPSPRIGFLAAVRDFDGKLDSLERAVAAAGSGPGAAAAGRALRTAQALRFNNLLDLWVTGAFLALAGLIVVVSAVEWVRLWAGRRPPDLKEEPATWLPESQMLEGSLSPGGGLAAGAAAVALGLVRHWSGHEATVRAREEVLACAAVDPGSRLLVPVPEVERDAERRRWGAAYEIAACRRAGEGESPCC